MTSMFTRAPAIGRHHVKGVWAEGDFDAGGGDLTLFHHAVDTLGHLVEPGERITGAQWLARIRRTYDASQPRMNIVTNAVARVMMVREWKDDRVLLDANSTPVFRGTAAQCLEHAHRFLTDGVQLRDLVSKRADELPSGIAEMAEVASINARLAGGQLVPAAQGGADLHPDDAAVRALFGAAPRWNWRLKINPGHDGDLLRRELQLLALLPALEAGADLDDVTADATLLEDHVAQLALIRDLERFAGYSSVVTTQRLPGFQPLPPRADMAAGDGRDIGTDELQDSLEVFMKSIVSCGIQPSKGGGIYLTRPAPVVNGSAARLPGESQVHGRIFGVQLLPAFVERMYQSSVAPQQADRTRERASC